MMKRLVITWVLAATLFGLTGVAVAVRPADRPFINISTTPAELDLGTSPYPGIYDIPAALTVVVESNCVHGPIMISATKLRHRFGGSISPERILVKARTTGGFVAMARPVAISKPTAGSHRIVLDFRVQTEPRDYAGKYAGTITVTVMPVP
jgi:hypothetical protein